MDIVCPTCNNPDADECDEMCEFGCKTIYCGCDAEYYVKDGKVYAGHDSNCPPEKPEKKEKKRKVKAYNAW